MRLTDRICKWEIWDRDGDKAAEPSGQVLIGYICVLLSLFPSRATEQKEDAAAKLAVPQLRTATGHWLCSVCSEGRRHQEAVFKDLLEMHFPLHSFFFCQSVKGRFVYVCAAMHLHVRHPREISLMHQRGSFKKRPVMVVSCQVQSHVPPLRGRIHPWLKSYPRALGERRPWWHFQIYIHNSSGVSQRY